MISHIIYLVLKFYVKLSLHLYYKNYQVQGLENVSKGPLILVANHQNAFMDALLVTCATKRNPYFLARASIFKTKWASVLLNIIRLIPIYRIRDGFHRLKENEDVFDQCATLLSSNKAILIFPEGNHENKYKLRPLQKGAARIAFDAESRHNFKLNLRIVPVGIQYEEYDGAGNSVLVSFGEAVSIRSYIELFEKNSKFAIQTLTLDLQKQISKLIVDIPEKKYDTLYQKWILRRSRNTDLRERLFENQVLISNLDDASIGNVNVNEKDTSHSIIKAIRFPFWLISKVNLFIPNMWISYRIKNKLKEPMFEGSMRFALWAFPGMIMLLIQAGIIYLLTTNQLISLGYLGITLLIAITVIKTKPSGDE